MTAGSRDCCHSSPGGQREKGTRNPCNLQRPTLVSCLLHLLPLPKASQNCAVTCRVNIQPLSPWVTLHIKPWHKISIESTPMLGVEIAVACGDLCTQLGSPVITFSRRALLSQLSKAESGSSGGHSVLPLSPAVKAC